MSTETENKIFTIGSFLLIALIYAFIALGILAGYKSLTFFSVGSLTLPSLLLFLIICVLSAWRRNLYFLFLFFVILAFPAPIDDLAPSVLLTNPDDRTQVAFPLITRIDVYLLLGIILAMLKRGGKLRFISFSVSLKVLLILSGIVLLAHVMLSEDWRDYHLLFGYSFHLRYLLLFLILLSCYDLFRYQKQILYGLIISIIFLLLEALINTQVRGSSRLLSGSLSLNTFANIAAAFGVYFIILIRKNLWKKEWLVVGLTICVIIIFGSKTRGAFITMILALGLLYVISNHKKMVLNFLKVMAGIGTILILYLYASQKEYLPDRYSFNQLSERIEIDPEGKGLHDIIKIKPSPETNSIRSRLDLFESSIQMIQERPFIGIGSGRWNRYKNEYSERPIPKVLLDTHNDFLALLSQYGIPLGLLWIYLVFMFPYLHRIQTISADQPYYHFYAINFAMAIAAFSNAGFFKHQIAAVLIFSFCVTHKLIHDEF